ncbi:BTB/POZ domain-containing protein 6-like [Mytilus galloprovincialis]|uniref:BTB/POZ domain-containing protein 3/6 n=1 Tax=Mytilus galloprovincialis TaxID=29158 RepID=A0A8B6FSZ1_MYTGA|nr:BTB/POZ domain-containing protein 3/6 [Mytilus galloprovincialis]
MESRDWQNGRSLPERMFHMLNHQLMCDVTFYVGTDKKVFNAHRCMLASASPVFYSMFEGPMAEKGEITIPDLDNEIFTHLVRFMYTDQIEVNTSNVKGLLYGAEKYMLQTVKSECSQFLSTLIDEDHACVVLQTANDFHLEELKHKSLQYIHRHGKQCLVSESLSSLSPECLKLVIESDSLKCKEDFIFEQVVKWGEHKCGDKDMPLTDDHIRESLGDILHDIRFPLMDRKYFTHHVSTRHILSSDEIIRVFQSFDGINVEKFPSKLRLPNPVKFYRCIANEGHQSWTLDGSVDSIEFSTDFDGLLLGIIVFGSKDYKGDHDITVKIIQFFTVLTSTTTSISSKEGQEIYDIMFIDPVKLTKNVRYTIQLCMKGPKTFTGKNYATRIMEDDLSVTFSFGVSSLNGTNETSGQIPGIIVGRQLE